MATEHQKALLEAAFSSSRPSTRSWRHANCPFCIERGEPSPDTKWRLSFNTETGKVHCFRCKFKGYWADAILGGVASISPVWSLVPPKQSASTGATIQGVAEEDMPPHTFEYLAGDDSLTFAPARAYLAKRGVSDQVIASAHIGACWGGWYADRIVIPVLDATARYWIGFVARTHLTGPALEAATQAAAEKDRQFLRYKYPVWPGRGEHLYNEYALSVGTDLDPVMVVEGAFDALPHWPDVVACLGKPTHQHVDLLTNTHRPIVIALDGDAWRDSLYLYMQLAMRGKRVVMLRLPPGADPSSHADWVRSAMAEVCPMLLDGGTASSVSAGVVGVSY